MKIIKQLEPISQLLPNKIITENYYNISRPTCHFIHDKNVIPITPQNKNQGWAMSPDQSCYTDTWCPYACKSGMYSTQWDPLSKCPNGPKCGSMNGGLYCNSKSQLIKPFPNLPLCKDTEDIGFLKYKLKQDLKIEVCQTVYPGNEAMLIPTEVSKFNPISKLNVPPRLYWQNTTAHYYINLPSKNSTKNCVWGKQNEPRGNWAPYVLGAGTGSDGLAYLSLKWNPLFIERNFTKKIGFSVDFKCKDKDGCHGLPCGVNPSSTNDRACTVAVNKGVQVDIQFSNY